jgi:3-deoxy-D-manno-octulosonic-acid transferase
VLRLFYSLLMCAALPLMVVRLYWRSLKEPRYRHHLGERFGNFAGQRLDGAIWMHAVSVGEMRAAQPLVDALRRRHPASPLLMTCMTPTGRETARKLYGEFATIVYLPYDLGFLVRRLIAAFRPRLLVVMETEIWPNLVATCRAKAVPVFLVNGRLSEKSFSAYRKFAPVRALIGATLADMQGVAAQHAKDAERLAQLGARDVHITGNLKFDVLIDPHAIDTGLAWRGALAPMRRVMLAVSTREGEERALAEAYAHAFTGEARRRQLLVIVPRHPQRFDEVAALVAACGLTLARRSFVQTVPAEADAWLGDSMGEVAAYVAMCDFAFVGGSLLPLGGQNLIEVCAQGKPVLMGPSTFNFAEAARAARAAGALIQVADADEAMRAAQTLFDDADACARHAQAAHEFTLAHHGATQKTIALIEPALATT